MKTKEKWICILVAILMIASASATVNATSKYLKMGGIKWQAQKKTNWCWAAGARNAVRYEFYEDGKSGWRSQESIVKKTYGSTVNKAATIEQTRKGAIYASNNTKTYVTYNGVASYNSLKTQINQGDVIILFATYSAGGGHVVTMHGYNTDGSKIRYFDPGNGGKYHTCTYSSFKNGTYNSRKLVADVYLKGK